MAYFRSDIDIIVFFLLGGMKMSGSAGLFNNNIFFYLVGSPKVGGAGDGKKKTATLTEELSNKMMNYKFTMLCTKVSLEIYKKGVSIYTGGVCSGTSKKGGLRNGHNPQKGWWCSARARVEKELRIGLVKKTILVTDVAQKGALGDKTHDHDF